MGKKSARKNKEEAKSNRRNKAQKQEIDVCVVKPKLTLLGYPISLDT